MQVQILSHRKISRWIILMVKYLFCNEMLWVQFLHPAPIFCSSLLWGVSTTASMGDFGSSDVGSIPAPPANKKGLR